jgi:hypothetical protein
MAGYVAAQEISEAAARQRTIETEIVHEEGTAPYVDYETGDLVNVPSRSGTPTSEVVRSIETSETDEGDLMHRLTLGAILLEPEEALQQAVKKMANGTLRGQSRVATPVSMIQPIIGGGLSSSSAQGSWSLSGVVLSSTETDLYQQSTVWASDTTGTIQSVSITGHLTKGSDPVEIVLWGAGGGTEMFRARLSTSTDGGLATVESLTIATPDLVSGNYFFTLEPYSSDLPDQAWSDLTVDVTITGPAHSDVTLTWGSEIG